MELSKILMIAALLGAVLPLFRKLFEALLYNFSKTKAKKMEIELQSKLLQESLKQLQDSLDGLGSKSNNPKLKSIKDDLDDLSIYRNIELVKLEGKGIELEKSADELLIQLSELKLKNEKTKLKLSQIQEKLSRLEMTGFIELNTDPTVEDIKNIIELFSDKKSIQINQNKFAQ